MKQKLLLVSLFLLLFLWYARYAAAPVVDFTVDDWSIVERAQGMSSYADAWRVMLTESNRPFGVFALMVFFRGFGDNLLLYSLLSYVTNAVFLLSIIGLSWLLLRDLGAVLIAGSLFCVLPNLTESFNWPTMICYGPGFAAFPVSALLWVRYVQQGGRWTLAGSALAFAFGLGTYELGIGLPLVFLAIWACRRPLRQGLIPLIPFAGVIAAYLIWRLTGVFGHAQGAFFVSRTPSFSLYGMFCNFREIVGWWLGGGMLDSFRYGANGFAQMGLWSRRLLFVGNLAAVAGLAILLHRSWRLPNRQMPMWRLCLSVAMIGLLWAAVTHALSLISWTGGRLNYVPAVGVVLAVAALLSRGRYATVMPVLGLVVFACLFSVEGTASQWKESGRFNRQLFGYLERTQESWLNQKLMWMDTRSLRGRLREDLQGGERQSSQYWAYNGNAGLIRGFAPSAMVRLIAPNSRERPRVLLDVECGASREGDTLVWHERYDPSKPRETPMADVYRVDCLSAGQRP